MRVEIAQLTNRSWRSWLALTVFVAGCLVCYFGLRHLIPRGSPSIFLALLPGFVLLFLIAAPVTRKNIRTVWLAHHLCPECGYDMRASPERCPECGFQVPKQNSSTEGKKTD